MSKLSPPKTKKSVTLDLIGEPARKLHYVMKKLGCEDGTSTVTRLVNEAYDKMQHDKEKKPTGSAGSS